jgi:hypothetical protein
LIQSSFPSDPPQSEAELKQLRLDPLFLVLQSAADEALSALPQA